MHKDETKPAITSVGSERKIAARVNLLWRISSATFLSTLLAGIFNIDEALILAVNLAALVGCIGVIVSTNRIRRSSANAAA